MQLFGNVGGMSGLSSLMVSPDGYGYFYNIICNSFYIFYFYELMENLNYNIEIKLPISFWFIHLVFKLHIFKVGKHLNNF